MRLRTTEAERPGAGRSPSGDRHPAAGDRAAHGRSSSGRLQRSLDHIRGDSDSLPSPSEIDTLRYAASAPGTGGSHVGPLTDSDARRLREENRNLRRLQEVIHFLNGAESLDALVPEIVGLGLSISGCTRGLLALLGSKADNGDRSFKVRVVRGITRDERSTPEVRVLRRLLAKCLEDRKPIFDADARAADTQARLDAAQGGARLALGAVAAVPLEHGGELLGALLLDEPSRTTPFTRAETDLLQNFARQAATALARLGEQKRLEKRSQRLRSEREALKKQVGETQSELSVLRSRSGEHRKLAERLSDSGRIPDPGRLSSGREPSGRVPHTMRPTEAGRISEVSGRAERADRGRELSGRSERTGREDRGQSSGGFPDPRRDASSRLAGTSARLSPPSAVGGRDRFEELLGRTFSIAKRSFLKRYLQEAITRAEGDLVRASTQTGLGVAKLVRLLELYEVKPVRGAGSALSAGSSASTPGPA